MPSCRRHERSICGVVRSATSVDTASVRRFRVPCAVLLTLWMVAGCTFSKPRYDGAPSRTASIPPAHDVTIEYQDGWAGPNSTGFVLRERPLLDSALDCRAWSDVGSLGGPSLLLHLRVSSDRAASVVQAVTKSIPSGRPRVLPIDAFSSAGSQWHLASGGPSPVINDCI